MKVVDLFFIMYAHWHSILIECVTDTKIYFLLQDFIVSDLLFSFWSPAGEENKSQSWIRIQLWVQISRFGR